MRTYLATDSTDDRDFLIKNNFAEGIREKFEDENKLTFSNL